MFPLVILMPHGEGIFVPDQHLAHLSERFIRSSPECTANRLCMPDIKRSARFHDFVHPRESRDQEIIELLLQHVVILDRQSIELFINDGQQVATTAVCTPLEAEGIRFFSDKKMYITVEKYDIVL